MADGTWEPDFDEVITTLDAQVAEHGGGAAVCVYHRGRPVVDAWTGAADTEGTPWRSDSIAVSYSTTKGVTSTALHICADRDLVDYDDRVADHGPSGALPRSRALRRGVVPRAARADPRLGRHGRRPRADDARVRARHEQRLPRGDVRLHRRRDRPPGVRPRHHRVRAPRDRGAARARRVLRGAPARGDGSPG